MSIWYKQFLMKERELEKRTKDKLDDIGRLAKTAMAATSIAGQVIGAKQETGDVEQHWKDQGYTFEGDVSKLGTVSDNSYFYKSEDNKPPHKISYHLAKSIWEHPELGVEINPYDDEGNVKKQYKVSLKEISNLSEETFGIKPEEGKSFGYESTPIHEDNIPILKAISEYQNKEGFNVDDIEMWEDIGSKYPDFTFKQFEEGSGYIEKGVKGFYESMAGGDEAWAYAQETGDTMFSVVGGKLSHVNPNEKYLLDNAESLGYTREEVEKFMMDNVKEDNINPYTGLPEYEPLTTAAIMAIVGASIGGVQWLSGASTKASQMGKQKQLLKTAIPKHKEAMFDMAGYDMFKDMDRLQDSYEQQVSDLTSSFQRESKVFGSTIGKAWKGTKGLFSSSMKDLEDNALQDLSDGLTSEKKKLDTQFEVSQDQYLGKLETTLREEQLQLEDMWSKLGYSKKNDSFWETIV